MPLFGNNKSTTRVYMRRKSLKLQGYVVGAIAMFSAYVAYSMLSKPKQIDGKKDK